MLKKFSTPFVEYFMAKKKRFIYSRQVKAQWEQQTETNRVIGR